MGDVRQLLEEVAANAHSIMARVAPQQRFDPTPCSEWNVQALMNHIAGGTLMFGAAMRGEEPRRLPGDADAEDYQQAVAELLEAVQQPGAMDRTLTRRSGEVPARQFLITVVMDTLVHSWDLAKATGQDTKLPENLVEAVYESFEVQVDQMRERGAFGPRVAVAEDADLQTRMLAMFGRKA